ncbi:MAG: hypothetical protein AAGA53_05590 [Pseudomonadota bacterium]
MTEDEQASTKKALAALITPLARLMIDAGISLPDGVELLKIALVECASKQNPEASASHLSLLTGVHRKDIKRLERKDPMPVRSSSAARVLALWQSEDDFTENGEPKPLTRDGEYGFDALVALAKIDAAPATMLSVLRESGNIIEKDGTIQFVSATVVPDDQQEKLKVAVATLKPHLDTTINNVLGGRSQWDQALRYSHLSKEAAQKLEKQASERFLQMLQELGQQANEYQKEEEGNTLFVAGTYTHVTEQDE